MPVNETEATMPSGMDAHFAIRHAKQAAVDGNCRVWFTFKGVRVDLDSDSDTGEVYSRWHREWKSLLSQSQPSQENKIK